MSRSAPSQPSTVNVFDMPTVNLDAASGLPLSPAGRAALMTALDCGWADPRRLYHEARVARQLLDAARSAFADILKCPRDNVIFTQSGSQAAVIGLLGLARARDRAGTAVVASAVEHSAVLAGADMLTHGKPALVPVTSEAQVDPAQWGDAVSRPGVAVAALQSVNPEIGTIQPIDQCYEAAQTCGVPLLVDACAGFPWLGAPPRWDALVISAHKWGGPKGVGVLALGPGTRWRPPDTGLDPELGCPNIPAVVAAAAALEDRLSRRVQIRTHCQALSNRIREVLPQAAPDLVILGPSDPRERVGNIVAATVVYSDGEILVSSLDRAGFAVASGSACTSDTRRPSHVLAAMGALTHGNLRISVSEQVNAAQVEDFLNAIPGAITAARTGIG